MPEVFDDSNADDGGVLCFKARSATEAGLDGLAALRLKANLSFGVSEERNVSRVFPRACSCW